jgi:hypothetical protein
MPLSYSSFFLPMTFILTLGVSSCKTANPEFRVIQNVPNAQAETLPAIVVSKNSPARPELNRILPKLDALQNLTGNQVRALLGTPSFMRSDSPAEMWQYRTDSCTLDLFLYENLDTGIPSVAHYGIRLQPGQALTKTECYGIVVKESTQAS